MKDKHLHYPNDPNSLRQAIRQLVARGHDVQRCTVHHIKVGPVNYFPSTGAITIDPSLRHPRKGFQELLSLLENKQQAEITLEPIVLDDPKLTRR